MSKDLPLLVTEVRVNKRQQPKGTIEQPFHNVTFFLGRQAAQLENSELFKAFEDISLAKKPNKRTRKNTGEVTIQIPVSVVAAESIKAEFKHVLAPSAAPRSKQLAPLQDDEKVDRNVIEKLHVEIGAARYEKSSKDDSIAVLFKLKTSSVGFASRKHYRLAQSQLEKLMAQELKAARETAGAEADDPFSGLDTKIEWLGSGSNNPALSVEVKGFESKEQAQSFWDRLDKMDLLKNPLPKGQKPVDRGR